MLGMCECVCWGGDDGIVEKINVLYMEMRSFMKDLLVGGGVI